LSAPSPDDGARVGLPAWQCRHNRRIEIVVDGPGADAELAGMPSNNRFFPINLDTPREQDLATRAAI
jgi:hypothetical protein